MSDFIKLPFKISELKPCPFCGERLVIDSDHHGEWAAHKDDSKCWLRCDQVITAEHRERWNKRPDAQMEAHKAELARYAAKDAEATHAILEMQRVDKPGQWIVKPGKTADEYFYVQHVQRNGKLKGLVVWLTRDGKFQGEKTRATIEAADTHDWTVVTLALVNYYNLNQYV